MKKGKAITTNADRQLRHGARINLQRYKLRRQNLHDCLQKQGWLGTEAMYEEGKASTFETYKLRAKAAEEENIVARVCPCLVYVEQKTWL